jgi:hypothetical protein
MLSCLTDKEGTVRPLLPHFEWLIKDVVIEEGVPGGTQSNTPPQTPINGPDGDIPF